MTIQEQFEHKRVEAINLLNSHAPEQVRQQLIATLRPAAAIQTERVADEEIPIGRSKFGGAPDLPPEVEWPSWLGRPFGFFGQLNLAEVAPFDIENELPAEGILSFFGRFFDESKNDNGEEIKVLHFAANALQRSTAPDGITRPDCEIIPSQRMTFFPEWTAREFFHTELEGVWDFNNYIDDFLPRFGRRKGLHRVLGIPPTIQDPPFIGQEMERTGLEYQENEKIIEAGARNWRSLLQLDFKEPDYYYGVASFIMHKDELARRDWEAVQFVYQGD